MATVIEVTPGTRGCTGQDEWDHRKSGKSKHVVDVRIDEGSLPTGAHLGIIKTEAATEDVSVFEVKESQSENRGEDGI